MVDGFLIARNPDELSRLPACCGSLPTASSRPPAEPTTAQVRGWARNQGYDVPDRGRLRPHVWSAWQRAHEPVLGEDVPPDDEPEEPSRSRTTHGGR